MKKRVIAWCLAVTCALGGVAMAAGGTQNDPLISRSYLEGAYLERLDTIIRNEVNTQTEDAYTEALERLDELADRHLETLANGGGALSPTGWRVSNGLTAQSGSKGVTLTLSEGSVLLWNSGSATVSGVLVDATAGKEVAQGGKVTETHRYIVASSQVTITVTSASAQWMVDGLWLSANAPVTQLPFTDVPESSWYYDAVCYMVELGLFNGTSHTTFEPETTMQRGMMATVLYRVEGEPRVQYAPMFSDVPRGMYYTNGAIWAGRNGLVNDTGNGKFRPTDAVTRQEMIVALYQYAQMKGYDTSARGEISSFVDGQQVAPWAKDAMSWAIGIRLVQGDDQKRLLPAEDATRAEVATMLCNFQKWVAVH